ncbi:MAG: DMT family transporter [Mariprofundales bacterium]|nr:DMT family transporter [Mariprofundales bacterium]
MRLDDSKRTIVLTTLAMLAFAANSLLCREALKHTAIDAASFTSLRLLSGAVMLWIIVRWRSGASQIDGDWRSAGALFVYAAGFSFAYRSLSAATGALLLYGAIHATMTGHGIASGERLQRWQIVGLLIALAGMVGLLLPGLAPPPLGASLLMLTSGVAWGIYSLLGKSNANKGRNPINTTAGNFLRAVPLAVVLSLIAAPGASWDANGVGYALLSGAITSGLGYVIWYEALPALRATQAATVQLCVPVLTALGGAILLAEPITLRIIVASAAILGGIGLLIHHHDSLKKGTVTE